MKKIVLTLIIGILEISQINAQNLFIIGSKSYRATESFTFKSNSDFGEDLEVQIAKKESGGMIILKTKVISGDDEHCRHYIKGNITIYLDDATVISCIDRNIYDSVDGTITTVYYLTASEISKLKLSNINTIRYKIDAGSCYSSGEGNFSASNESSGYSYFKKEKADIPQVLLTLFE